MLRLSAVPLLACLWCAPAGAADAPDRWQALAPAMFDHLVPADRGFPSPIVMKVVQDGDGFMWFGTQAGLGRWDGYHMRNFFFDADDSHSLPGDFVQALHVDGQGRLWIGTTTDGLAMYDKQQERFIRYAAGKNGLSSPAIGAIASDGRGGIWVGTGAGLDYIDSQNGNAISHLPRAAGAAGGPRSNQIRALLVDRGGNLWIASNGGLARRDAATGRVDDIAIAGGVSDAVLSLGENAQGGVVFGTFRSGIGLAGADAATAGARMLVLDQVKDSNNAMVLSLAETRPGQWWAATYGGGIIEFDADGHGRRIVHRPAIAISLANDRVAALWRDRSGLMWVANERGVDVHNPRNSIFSTILDGVGMPEVSVPSFMTDSAGRLWVGLADQGIDLVAADGSRTAGLRPDPLHPETALPNRMITAMAEAEPQEAWIGTLLGLYHTSGKGSRVVRVPLPHTDPLPRIGAIVPQDGVLWLGTANGLLRYDPRAGKVQVYGQGPADSGGLSDSRISTILAAPDGALWIGTRNGLNRFDPASGKAEQIMPAPEIATRLPQGFINWMAFDAQGRLWVATNSGGVAVLDGRAADGTRRFHRVGLEAGMPSKFVNGLRADAAGRMWASTSEGIAVIDTGTLRAQALGRADGLVYQAYYGGSVGQTAHGEIVF
ncbi:MAG: two-component regulator propeller domain-containing protein, partial [Pseudomonadota bacterium]